MCIYGVTGKEESKKQDPEGINWELLFNFLREMQNGRERIRKLSWLLVEN